MKKLIAVLALYSLATPVAGGGWETGLSLHADMESGVVSKEMKALGYILGCVDGFNSAVESLSVDVELLDESNQCVPKIKAGQVELIVKKYLNDHPEDLHYVACSLVMSAVIEAGHCWQKGASR